MNNSFYTKKIFLFLLAICWFGDLAYGQTTNIEVYRETVLKNGTYTLNFNQWDFGYAPKIQQEASHGDGYFSPSSCCGGNQGVKGYPAANNFYYKPSNNFVGLDTVIFSYNQQRPNGLSAPAWKVFYFTVVPSVLVAKDDYVATTEGQSIEIAVLSNDYGTGTNQVVADITNINNGTAVKTSNNTKVTFTPSSGFKGIANLNYSICDAQGACSYAVVNICVNSNNPPAQSTLQLTTNKNKAIPVMVLDMDASFSLDVNPSNGSLQTIQGQLHYVPNNNYVGNDQFVYENPDGKTRTVNVKVVSVPNSSSVINNDLVFTPKNQIIDDIDLIANDNGSYYYTFVGLVGGNTTEKGGTLVYLQNLGKGHYSYIPPANFTGVDKFRYRVLVNTNPAVYDTATCHIVVNDLNPSLTVFHMTTPKNTPLVLGDHLPFDIYSYENLSTPAKGNIEFLPGYDTYSSQQNSQTFSGTNMLVYDPDVNALGHDEFEFEYCADGLPGGCQLVKVELEIVEIANPQPGILCAGSDCVWSGDANRDGMVDVRDVLPIGMYMGEIGQNRSNASTTWYGQHANDWQSFFATGLGFDVKFLDTDGNGIVSNADTSAIGLNYGNYHNLTPSPVQALENLPFYIEEPNFPENPEIGDVFYAPIVLGTNNIPAINAYGLAFELLYDPAFFEVNIIFNDNAWMDYNSPILSMTKKPVAGKIDAAYTRTSGLAASGFGHIGLAEFIVIDDVNGNRPTKLSSKITLNGLGLMNGNGQVAGLGGNSIEVAFGGNSNEVKPVTEDQLIVFPNPASQTITLHLNGAGHEMERVMVHSMTGATVYDSGTMTSKRMMVDVSDFPVGVYAVKVLANGQVLSKKIEVIR